MKLLDQYVPEFHFREYHEKHLPADRKRVFEVLQAVELTDSWIIRLLFRLRGLPTLNMRLVDASSVGFIRGAALDTERRPAQDDSRRVS